MACGGRGRKEVLVVGTKVKSYIKSKGMMSSADVLDALNDFVYLILDRAVERAKQNGRKTVLGHEVSVPSATGPADDWLAQPREEATPPTTSKRALLISDLGWSREDALETYARLRSFEEHWNAPGMEAYDAL